MKVGPSFFANFEWSVLAGIAAPGSGMREQRATSLAEIGSRFFVNPSQFSRGKDTNI